MNISNIVTAICSILFLSIGVDKFLNFLEPPCSMMNSVSPIIWKSLGVLQVVSGILIWLPKYRKYVAGFFAVFMLVFTIIHLVNNTYDIGRAAFMAVVLGLLAWNPRFIRGKSELDKLELD